MRIRVEMIGGPLDGKVIFEEVSSGQFLAPVWLGPDPASSRRQHAVVYRLEPAEPDLVERKLVFSPRATAMENVRRGLTP